MFALMTGRETELIDEHTEPGLAAARSRGHKGSDTKPKVTDSLIGACEADQISPAFWRSATPEITCQ